MKIVILANESRKAKDKTIIDEAKRVFDTVVYAPINKVRFDLTTKKSSIISLGNVTTGISIKFEGKDISDADYILPIPTIGNWELFYTVLRMLEDRLTPFDANTYMMISNEELLFSFLGSNGVNVRKSLVVASNISMDKINESVGYPVIVRPPRKRVMVTNKQTLKDVLSLYKFGTPICIESPIKSEKNVWVFVLEDDVIATYEKTRNVSRTMAADADVKKLAIKVRRLAGCDYCAMRFLSEKNEWILDQFTLSPNFSNFQKVTGANIGRYIISNCIRKVRDAEKPSWQKRVSDIFKLYRLKEWGSKGEWTENIEKV